MELTKTYILNPAYFLRNDIHRAVLGTYDNPDIRENLYLPSCVTLLHPCHAQMLSFFDGSKTLDDTVDNIARYFSLTREEVVPIVERYIDNEKGFNIRYNKSWISFPKYVLIEKQSYTRPENYQPEQFVINEELDLDSVRLYRPVSAILELTFDCFTDCVYCYADRSRRSSRDRLSIDRIKSIIREAKACGMVYLDINGGEVIMHPDYKEIFKELADNGYFPLISTKIPLKREVLEFLKAINMTRVQISIDSLNPETLCRTLKVKESYRDDIVNTMQMLDDMEFNWRVNIILTKYNVSVDNEVAPLISKLVSYKNIKHIQMGPAGCSLYKSVRHFCDIKIGLNELDVVKKYVGKISAEYPMISISGGDSRAEFENNKDMNKFNRRSRCTANERTFIILHDGKVTICEELYWHPKFIIGDLTKQSIMEMWSSQKARDLFYLNQEMMGEESACKTCDTFSGCRHRNGVCWKTILMAYGNEAWDFPDPKCPHAPDPIHAFYLE